MQFIDLKKQYQLLQSSIASRIQTVLEHGQFILGPEVRELETRLAEYVGVTHCISVANGTDALMIALMALQIGPGDEVITTPFTFIANAEMISLLGAKPIFVDIDPHTYNINANEIESVITDKTKCIMPISLFGQCADMDTINFIAEKYQLPVIEDAAQSFGAMYKHKKSCNLSTIACTSFFPSKPLGCYGDGGACFTNNDELAQKMRYIRTHGQEKRYHHTMLGLNSRLDTLQAAILLEKLNIFPREICLRQKVAKGYDDLLKNKMKIMQILPDNTCAYAQYTVELPKHSDRSQICKILNEANIPTAIHYPVPLHLQPIFRQKKEHHPHAELAAASVLSLPMHPYLTAEDQQYIVKHLLKAIYQSSEKVAC